MKHKVYILAFEANFTWKHFFTKPLKFVIKLWMVYVQKTFPYHHIADNYHYRLCNTLINHIVSKGGESINYKKYLKTRDSNVWAYELTCDIDIKRWHKDTLEDRNIDYDALGAFYSEAHEYKLFSFLNIKPNDKEFFCDERQTWRLQNQGYLKDIKNRKKVSTAELIEFLIDNKLCNPTPIHVWDGKNMINNIFKKKSVTQ